jgi:hypothetical protein
MANEQAIAVRQAADAGTGGALTVRDVANRVNIVHEVMQKVMQDGTHYGTVPGCGNKKVLLKPGADKLAMTFQLVPTYVITRTDLPNGHREYDVTCTMSTAAGIVVAQGVGSASTMERKYRYVKDSTGKPRERDDIADVYNTVLKIAKKRSHVDATITATGCADLFTQDLIETDEDPAPARAPVAMPTPRAAETTPPPADDQPIRAAPN